MQVTSTKQRLGLGGSIRSSSRGYIRWIFAIFSSCLIFFAIYTNIKMLTSNTTTSTTTTTVTVKDTIDSTIGNGGIASPLSCDKQVEAATKGLSLRLELAETQLEIAKKDIIEATQQREYFKTIAQETEDALEDEKKRSASASKFGESLNEQEGTRLSTSQSLERGRGMAAAFKADITKTRYPLMPFLQKIDETSSESNVKSAVIIPTNQQDIEPAPQSTMNARALLIICYNRPDYLTRSLNEVLQRLPSYNRPHIYISQDGNDKSVTDVINQFSKLFLLSAKDVPFTHLVHPTPVKLRGNPSQQWEMGYYKLSQHFEWALGEVFSRGHPRTIVLEDDISVGIDFFDYFSNIESILDTDHSVLAASAYNDLGQEWFVQDPKQLYRTDFFSGLGWMMTKHVWEELGPKWPSAFWDDWLREPPNRKARHFIRPEVSRTMTFGESGTSQAMFYKQFLGNIKVNMESVDWLKEDTSYLTKSMWEREFELAIMNAVKLSSIQTLVSKECKTGGDEINSEALNGFKYEFEDVAGYSAAATAFGFISDMKAGVPRTGFKGTVVVRHNGCRKFLVPGVQLDDNNALPH
jgi:alpha-1,3-mannosyl-glycoprotein beta-1,2-N-acetylglucosaminyltransferase